MEDIATRRLSRRKGGANARTNRTGRNGGIGRNTNRFGGAKKKTRNRGAYSKLRNQINNNRQRNKRGSVNKKHNNGGRNNARESNKGGEYSYCGVTWSDANSSCDSPCASGLDRECPDTMTCYADANSCPATGTSAGGGSADATKDNGGKGGNHGSMLDGWRMYWHSPPQKTGQGYKPLQGYWPSLNSKDEMCVYNDKYPNYMKTDIEFYFFDSINDCCRAWFKGDVKSCIEESTNYAHEDGNRWGSPPRHSSKAGKP